MTTYLLPYIPSGGWRRDAACARHPEPWLWDAFRDGETQDERIRRHNIAKGICSRCPVIEECATDIDETDEGIRAGELLHSESDRMESVRREAVRILTERGFSAAQIAAQVGITVRSVVRNRAASRRNSEQVSA